MAGSEVVSMRGSGFWSHWSTVDSLDQWLHHGDINLYVVYDILNVVIILSIF